MTASANVELVRSIFADFERGDFSSADWADPRIEWVSADGLLPGSRMGRAEMAQGYRDYLSAWEGYRLEADEYRELDDERVLVSFHRSGHGKASGLEVGRLGPSGAALYHICDGKVTKIVAYGDRDRALADLGLAPKTGSPGT